jgi:hypothetical protein
MSQSCFRILSVSAAFFCAVMILSPRLSLAADDTPDKCLQKLFGTGVFWSFAVDQQNIGRCEMAQFQMMAGVNATNAGAHFKCGGHDKASQDAFDSLKKDFHALKISSVTLEASQPTDVQESPNVNVRFNDTVLSITPVTTKGSLCPIATPEQIFQTVSLAKAQNSMQRLANSGLPAGSQMNNNSVPRADNAAAGGNSAAKTSQDSAGRPQ